VLICFSCQVLYYLSIMVHQTCINLIMQGFLNKSIHNCWGIETLKPPGRVTFSATNRATGLGMLEYVKPKVDLGFIEVMYLGSGMEKDLRTHVVTRVLMIVFMNLLRSVCVSMKCSALASFVFRIINRFKLQCWY